MRCPKCGIEMAVGARGRTPEGITLQFICRNKQCENHSKFPKEGKFAATKLIRGGGENCETEHQ